MVDTAILSAILRKDFVSFVRKVFKTVNPEANFVANWHILALCNQLLALNTGDCRRLIVNLPPRSLKSLIISVAWPAWLLGHKPNLRIIAASYSDDLSRRHARDFRRVVESSWYRETFHRMRLDPRKNTETELVTTLGGGRYATSVGGTLTGRGGDLIIIDDPIKPMEAASDVERRRVNEWFDTTVVTRLDQPTTGAIVVVMQRVHEDDLTGHLLEKGGWRHMAIPAIAVESVRYDLGQGMVHLRHVGDILEPNRYTPDYLESARRDLGTAMFEAQFQQNPIPTGGTLIKREWLSSAEFDPERASYPEVWLSWDIASKAGADNDWSVCTIWGICRGTYFLLEVRRVRLEFPELLALARRIAAQWRPTRVLIEDASSGAALIQALRRESNLAIRAIRPRWDKPARVQRASAIFEAGRVVLPTQASWLAEYQRELLSFPSGRHDDQVDSTTQFLLEVENTSPEPVVNPIIVYR